MKNRIYLDYNATTPMHLTVRSAMQETFGTCVGNPSSVHQEGQRARSVLEKAREEVAGLLATSAQKFIFTSGGTEANNLALFSWLKHATPKDPLEVITTPIEHPSVLQPLKEMEKQGRIFLKFLSLNANGPLNLEPLSALLTEKTALVSCMLVNNELGTQYPLEEIVRICRSQNAGVRVHCDAIQAVGRIPVHPDQLGVDSLSLSAHKFYGPKGVGGLWTNAKEVLAPLQYGGGQEGGVRSGTENLPGIVGLGVSCRIARQEMAGWHHRLKPLRDAFETRLLQNVDGCRINAQGSGRIYSTSNIFIKGVAGDLLQQSLDLAGMAVSTGSACASGTVTGSPILHALGQSDLEASQAIRISLGCETTGPDMENLFSVLQQSIARIRQTI